jgi:single-strand DNA-binding protein
MNNVSLVGRLTKDPEEKMAGETTATRFTVAVDRAFKKEGQPAADFISCVAFGKTAEFVAKYFSKGKSIGLTGRIQTGSYEKSDGTKVYTTDVIADKVEFVGGKSDGETKGKQEPSAPEGFTVLTDDDIPF